MLEPTSSRTASLLRSIFDETSPPKFVVLRNGESLPGGFEGTDLDVSVLPGVTVEEASRQLVERAARVGWGLAINSVRPHMSALAFVDTRSQGRGAVHFDVFDGISVFGIPLLDPEILRFYSTTHGGVRLLTAKGRVLATVVHHLAWNGRLSKAKYRSEMADLVGETEGRSWLEDALSRAFGSAIASKLTEPANVEALELGGRKRRARILMRLLAIRIRQRPFHTARQVMGYFGGQFRSLVAPPGIVGRPFDRVPGIPAAKLTLDLVCGISPHGFSVPSVRSAAAQCLTLNGSRYESKVRASWKRWVLVRWVFPSAYLWFSAKRGRVVVVDRIPFLVRLLQQLPFRPSWIAVSNSDP